MASWRARDTLCVLANGGDGTFAAPLRFVTGTGPGSVALGDFDRDRDLDAAVTNEGGANLSVLLNSTRSIKDKIRTAPGLKR